MSKDERPLLLGATAADPKRAVLIWNAIRKYFVEQGFPVEYALFSTYAAMSSALLAGHIDIAWNAPMAHAQLLEQDSACRTLAMRDTDENVTSLLVVRADSDINTIEDLRGRSLALGLETSSELWLLPVKQLAEEGIDVRSECSLVELEATEYSDLQHWVDDRTIFEAVVDGSADCGIIFEPWLQPLIRKHRLEADDVRTIWRTRGYAHCAFTSGPSLDQSRAQQFVDLLLAMSSDDPAVEEMMRMEHLKRWVRATDDGWSDLRSAIVEADLVGKIY
ncbi:MAG: PhnD/SsuA/transferrin family substrate-binding protein [Actinomycetota bacterium]|jgi:ABC-type phosphate/phosphonate transport system substrate-binding protein|nr:PhnD/SsuA/transferrin family substrate-binding protein [Actinomycetota bacterium]MEC9058578.1 PhnD/SsuA/transferrin family substrate-binding protein [Actinomycetota bacterium]MEE3256781.1 PhnD/SsuA/transferrin family substrate-binding protein [Actinomycetota bacterium]